MKVEIITIGDEILIGQIVDTNSAWMGQQLNLIGAEIQSIRTVKDSRNEIVLALNQIPNEIQVVLITGGLGPTKDDITKKVLADYFDLKLKFHEPTYVQLSHFLEKLGRKPTPAHRVQSQLPDGAIILNNQIGTAPGMWFDYQNKIYVSMPGVPYEMKYLMEKEVIPRLIKRLPSNPIKHHTIKTVGIGESLLAQSLHDVEDSLPSGIGLAYLPSLGTVRLRLTARGQPAVDLLPKYIEQVRSTVSKYIYSEDEDDITQSVGQMLKKNKMFLAVTESATGGNISHNITKNPGASKFFWGGVTSYDNQAKIDLLNVNSSTLEKYGAVSEQVAIEMAYGAVAFQGVDIAVSTTGIMGPTGATPTKPVGLVFLTVTDGNIHISKQLNLSKGRLQNIEYTTTFALNMVRMFLLKHYNYSKL